MKPVFGGDSGGTSVQQGLAAVEVSGFPGCLDSGYPIAGFGCGVSFQGDACNRVGRGGLMLTVGLLFLSCGPAAIIWGIWAVIVDSVKRVGGAWLSPHISLKVGETVPAGAYSYPPSAISVEPRVSGVAASLAHINPAPIKRVFLDGICYLVRRHITTPISGCLGVASWRWRFPDYTQKDWLETWIRGIE